VAVLGRLLVSSAERLDLPDLLSLDSYAAGDWKFFLKGLVGDTKPYILKGFDVIDPGNAIGTQACSIRVADSVVFYPGSNSGSFYYGLPEGNSQSAPLVPELRKNAVNYVYLTFNTVDTSIDTRAFWDPDKDGGVGGEFSQDVNTESVLSVQVNVSTGSFPANTIPVAKIKVGAVTIESIEDARDLMFRLGSGGINPNAFNTYTWRSLPSNPYQRSEPSTQMLSGGVNPFQGADKNILTLKEWMDAIMSKVRELGGTTYWYDDTSSFGLVSSFFDACGTTFKSKGKWVHDTVTPGLLTWSEDVQIKMTSDPRSYIVRQGSKTLLNEQVMYIPMVRNQLLNATDDSVSWTNGQNYVNTVGGAVGLFTNLAKGDYVKKINDSFDKWLRVEEFYDAVNLGGSTTTAAGARSIRLSSTYLGVTGNEKGRYDKGSYVSGDITVSNRNVATISNTGGNFHWLAMRSDTIENTSNLVSNTLSLAISDHDGITAKVVSASHGLVDGDRLTIAGTTNFNGTYKVEVETANIFYITKSGGPFANESGTGYFATVTTASRSTAYGFQEESANHGFSSDDTIVIAGTTNYDNSYLINVTGTTTFTIPISAAFATETSGTATLARLIVRSEGTGQDLIQGQIIDIGGSSANNIRSYVGMSSLSQTAPSYSVLPGYNSLDGMQDFNALANENLTSRVSKLTAMMADKAQDKTVKYLPGTGINIITNTTNGAAQEITFNPSGAILNLATPGSDGSAVINLPNSAPGISLLVNQVAYVTIDRNNASTPSISVSNLASLPVGENIFVIAVRLSATDTYLWDGTLVPVGSTPGPGFLNTVVRQNQALKLVEGGIWSWVLGTQTVAWSAAAFIQIPGLANSVNQIAAGSAVLAAGQVAYVDINRVGPGGLLTVNVASNASLAMVTDRFIIARRVGSDLIVGNHSMLLVDGESKKLYAGTSNETLGAIGLTSAADKGDLRILQQIGAVSKRIIISPIDSVVFDNTTWGNEISGLRMKFDGIQIDMETGQYFGYGDGTLAGSGALIGSAFTPTAFTSPNLFRWYSINLVADTLNADGTMNVKPLILAGASGISSATAVKAPFSSKKIGQVLVQAPGSGSTINNIVQSNIFQLASGAGSGGEASLKLVGGGTVTNNFISGSAVVASALGITGNGSPVNKYKAIPFTIGVSRTITSITLSLRQFSGAANVTVSICPNVAGDPNEAAPLAAGTTNVFDSNFSDVLFSFTPVTLAAGTYWIVVNLPNSIAIQGESGGIGGVKYTNDAGATWLADGDTAGLIRYQVFAAVTSLELSFTNDLYLEKASLNYSDNAIPVSESPIVFANDLDVAYVIPNLSAGGPNLSVVVDTLPNVSSRGIIIARREGNNVIVGSSSTRLIPGESKKLYAGVSDQLLNVIPATSNADSSGQLRLLQNTIAPKRVNVSSVSKVVPDGTEYGIQLKNLMMDFDGAQIVFGGVGAGNIYKADGTTLLGLTFTPATIAAGQYRWYSVTLLPNTVTVDNKITGQLIVIPASADGSSAALAPKAAFASSGIKIGQVVVQESSGSVANITQSALVQLGTGGGSSGTGDANAILETIKNHFVDATFDFVTPNIFASNEDDLVDVSSTGSYNIADNVFEIDSAETFVSKQMLDSEFLANNNSLSQVELMSFWNSAAIDTAATYQVSRNGGNEWQAVTMSRVGSTELYRGIHSFTTEVTQQTLLSQLTAGSDRDLNTSTQQEISQSITVASGAKLLLRQLIIAVTKTGSPTGNLYISICNDNSGNPNSVLAESNAITVASLVTGNNTITFPDTYLDAGTYHIKFRTDATYKSIFAGGTKIALQVNSAGSIPYARKYDGSVWSASSTDNLVYTVKGISLDLRVKIISSASARKLDGYGIFYDKSVGNISTGVLNREVFNFSGTANLYEFTLTKFIPNPDLLKVYDVTTGQVYTYGVWSLQGQKVVFEPGQFNSPGNALTLVFDQTIGGAFDNSDRNGLLLANNFLGSTDGSIDKSQNGRGIFLRRPDGTLREICIDNSDNIVVYSV